MKTNARAAAACEIRALERRRRQLARALAALEQSLRILQAHEAFAAPKQLGARARLRPRPLTN